MVVHQIILWNLQLLLVQGISVVALVDAPEVLAVSSAAFVQILKQLHASLKLEVTLFRTAFALALDLVLQHLDLELDFFALGGDVLGVGAHVLGGGDLGEVEGPFVFGTFGGVDLLLQRQRSCSLPVLRQLRLSDVCAMGLFRELGVFGAWGVGILQVALIHLLPRLRVLVSTVLFVSIIILLDKIHICQRRLVLIVTLFVVARLVGLPDLLGQDLRLVEQL